MKQSIAWHKECLDAKYLKEKEDHAARILQALEKERASYAHDSAQYEEAKRRGLDGYDEERFMKKRAPKVEPKI